MPLFTEEALMNRFGISLFGFRLVARGKIGIFGAILVTAMLVVFTFIAS